MNDQRSRIDPELARALAAVPIGPSGAIFDLHDIDGTRRLNRSMVESMAAQAPDDPSVSVEEHRVTREHGPDIGLHVLRPSRAAPMPAVLWFHGGGQVIGFAAQDDLFLARLCRVVGCVAVSVEYRLAPEFPAPAAAEDGLEACRWVRENAGVLGVDSRRVGLCGQSGGAGIAAAVALLARERDEPPAAFQALAYPMLDDRNTTSSSHEITDLGIWDRTSSLLAWHAVLGDRSGDPDVPPVCAPARAEDLTGLPPTFLGVGDLDCFRDEDLDYALRLRAAGVPVELHLYPGAYHAWDLFAPASALARTFHSAWFDYLTRQFSRPLPA